MAASAKNMLENINFHLFLAFILRIFLMLFGEWQDRNFVVKYTDVDYKVFTDAANYVYLGQSPYNRSTYRYTPILAWMLTPNIFLFNAFGKVIFILCDILTGYFTYHMVYSLCKSKHVALISTFIWLYNPLPAGVSSRGNAESIMSVLILLTFQLLSQKYIKASALIYALSIHVKIYPISYALAIYFFLNDTEERKSKYGTFVRLILPSKNCLMFGIVSGGFLFLLTAIGYYSYGYEFLYETYLYHVVRKDIRHNFSVYFYMLYLTAESPMSQVLSIVTFLPQVILLITISVKYYNDLSFCCFLQTVVFVTFNKVCTSQYFLWYLSLLPLVLPSLYMPLRTCLLCILLWLLGQGCWLTPAYYLEMEGNDTFVFIWAAGLTFFTINVWISSVFIKHYIPRSRNDGITSTLKCQWENNAVKFFNGNHLKRL